MAGSYFALSVITSMLLSCCCLPLPNRHAQHFTLGLLATKLNLPLRAKLAMARAPASCSWWLWDGIQDRTLWKTLPFPPSNSFCMDSSTQREGEGLLYRADNVTDSRSLGQEENVPDYFGIKEVISTGKGGNISPSVFRTLHSLGPTFTQRC